jgi:hypothetical protein
MNINLKLALELQGVRERMAKHVRIHSISDLQKMGRSSHRQHKEKHGCQEDADVVEF